MTEHADNGFTLLTTFLAVVLLEHITAQEVEVWVKIFCQIVVTSATVWIIVCKNKDNKKP